MSQVLMRKMPKKKKLLTRSKIERLRETIGKFIVEGLTIEFSLGE